MRYRDLRGVLATSAAICAVALATPANARIKTFDVPAQPAATGIPELAAQADVQILVSAAAVRGRNIRAIKGAMSVDQAVRRAAADAGLRVVSSDGRTYTLALQTSAAPAAPSAIPEASVPAEIIVTAQKRAEAISDVPIAISAFSAESLQEQKIESGTELMRGIPNVTFSKNNYSGYNFSIRGVGTKAVSATSDPGVAVSFNNVALIRNRLFEQEYFDIERVEVLRGPQGTLYGRNATAGVVNMITAKPDLDDFTGSGKVEAGNYKAMRATGMINIPIVDDVLAVRAAGAWTSRDGYGYNLATDERVDGRDLWSTRLSLAFKPSPRLRINATWEHFNENDDRLRTGKQLCHRDPGPSTFPGVFDPDQPGVLRTLDPLESGRLSQGCRQGSLYDDGAYASPNGLSIPFIAAGQMLGLIGFSEPFMFPDGSFNPNAEYVRFLKYGIDPYNVEQSRDLRTISSLFPAQYRAKADIFALDVSFDATDALTITSQTLYNEDRVYSLQDYHRFSLQPTFNDSNGLFTYSGCTFSNPAGCGAPSEYSNFTPGGIFTDPQLGPSNSVAGVEISSSESWQFSQELRLVSDFDGPLNFSAGANYLKFKGLNDYYLFFNIVTMLAQGYYNASQNIGECLAFPGNCMTVDPNPIGSLDGDGHNYFRNRNPYELESIAGFGEVYWEATPNLKLTAGLRYTEDRKKFTPWRSQLLVPGDSYGPADPIRQKWGEFTGRIGIDWKPDLSFADDTMIYAFYSRGYKGGGANPPPAQPIADYLVVSEIPPTFEPEFVNAFELGFKNSFLGGALTLNGSAFYYDYTDYQVSKVVDRTVVNENFDASVWGAELETVWSPAPRLRLNATLGYLDTRIKKGERSIDIFNRTQGRDGWSVISPWVQQTSNCILPNDYLAQIVNFGLFPAPATFASPIIQACNSWTGVDALSHLGLSFDPADYPEANNGAGFYDDLSGNELPNSPHTTFNLGAQYTVPAGDWEMTLRGDYYRQSGSYARVYNLESDRLRGWDNVNLSLTVARPADDLVFQAYVKNVFNKTPITDAFLNSDSTGMTTNVFTLDPRIIGFSIAKKF